MMVRIELPLSCIESLFNALHHVNSTNLSRQELKAISLMKASLYFELEAMLITEDEKIEQKTDFHKLFQEAKERKYEFKKLMDGTY